MKLAGRTVLVTGGTTGIGLGIAEVFRRSKSRVIVCGRDRERLVAVERQLSGITALPCDVGDTRQREDLAAAAPGLASWFHNCNKAALAKLFNLTPVQRVLFGQTIGYAADEDADG